MICPYCNCANPGLHVQGCPTLATRGRTPLAINRPPRACVICHAWTFRWSRHHLQTRKISGRVATLCDPCHDWVHRTFTIRQLRDGVRECNTVEGLRRIWWRR